MSEQAKKTAAQFAAERNKLSITVGSGAEARVYNFRRLSARIRFLAKGSQAFGAVRGALKEADSPVLESTYYLVMEEHLRLCMFEPWLSKAGEPSDFEANVLSIDDMGDDAIEVFHAIMKSGGHDDLVDFPESSEDAMAE